MTLQPRWLLVATLAAIVAGIGIGIGLWLYAAVAG
jgi:hypothetical protein